MQNFSELSLSPALLRAIEEMGFTTPSPIQAQALPALLGAPTDFIGLAGTGTGKTAAFGIPLVSRIDPATRTVQAIILCPTRELAMQVSGQISLLGKYLKIKVATVYGGAPFGDQVRALKGGAQIVVGTPGRVIDHLERKTMSLSDVQTLVLDEADEMFSMGFKDEIDRIIEDVNEASFTWLFSATMSPEVRRVVNSSLKTPVTVQVDRQQVVAAGAEQFYYRCREDEKPELICKLIEAADDFYGLIFCQTKALVADLTRFMLDRGYKVDCLHGDMDQNSRERTMQAFRDHKLQVLICTDVAARGLDVKDITHVVNYSLPRELESYVHRIGRTARSGKTGIVMNLVTFSHRFNMTRIEQHTKTRMNEGFLPSKRDIAARKISRMLPAFGAQKYSDRVLEVMGEDFREALVGLTAEEVAARFITMMMPDTFSGESSGGGAKRASAASTSAAVAPRAASAPREVSAVANAVRPSFAAKAAPVVASVPKAVPAAEAAVAPAASAPSAADLDSASVEAAPAQKKYAPKVSAIELESSDEESIDLLDEDSIEMSDEVDESSELLMSMSDDESEDSMDEESGEPESSSRSTVSAKSFDQFGDEAVDRPPRKKSKKVQETLSPEDLAAILEEPTTLGVVKADEQPVRSPYNRSPRTEGTSRPEAAGPYSRSQAQFRGDTRSRFDERSQRYGDRPQRTGGFSRPEGARSDGGFGRDTRPSSSAGRFDRDTRPSSGFGGRDSRPVSGYGDRDTRPSSGYAGRDARPSSGFGGREARPARFDDRSQRPMGASRPMGSSRPMSSRPSGAASSETSFAPRAERPEQPMNLGKPPKHDAGPARTARLGETGGLNRRARRAALFGRTVEDGSSSSTTTP